MIVSVEKETRYNIDISLSQEEAKKLVDYINKLFLKAEDISELEPLLRIKHEIILKDFK